MRNFVNRTLLALALCAATSALSDKGRIEARQPEKSTGRLEGRVVDESNLPIPGARVTAIGGGVEKSALTDHNGQFSILELPSGAYQVKAEAEGFEGEIKTVELGDASVKQITFKLRIAPLTSTIVVTATGTERRIADVPASVTVLTGEDLRRSASQTIDDLLRQVPGFSLFRRSSSLVAHPTAQGVSLRGIGPSGVSRTLVLLDQMPFNDPFGGWVYWSKVPKESIERIEVVRGGGSSLYGNYALGGVINLMTRRPERRRLFVESYYGNRGTPSLDFFASDLRGAWGVALEGSVFKTDGYMIVPEEDKGEIDANAGSEHKSFNLKLEYSPRQSFSLFLRGGYFDEDRRNGTRLQENWTLARFLSAGARWQARDGSQWRVLLMSNFQDFHSTFTSIASGRSSERLTLAQLVPSSDFNASAQWSKQVSDGHLLVAGIDFRRIEGESREDIYDAAGARVVRQRTSGGQQRFVGLFLEDMFAPTAKLQLLLGARLDRWRNTDASQSERVVATGATTRVPFGEKSSSVISPRVSALYHLTGKLSIWGSFYKAFRAPTLNELYRQFRVGNIVTLANENLGPERISEGVEAGVNHSVTPKVFYRVTGFLNRMKDPISNVTLSSAQEAITRQRQNLGRTRIAGLESEVEYRPDHRWAFSCSYLFDEAVVSSFPANRQIEGKRIPQVPKHSFSLQARYSDPSLIDFAVSGRFVGQQFDDDLNEFRLDNFFVVDVTVSRQLRDGFEAFIAIENLFNSRFVVGRIPFKTLGNPLLVRGGLRLRM